MLISISRDMAEELLDQSLQRELSSIKAALDQSAIVAITDPSGLITHVNDKFCEISKYSYAELLGKNHRIINSGYHPKSFFEQLWRTISRGQVWVGEICNRAKDGKIYWVHTTIVPFKDSEGRIEKFVSIRFEITERKEMEQQMLVQDRLASIGLLASGLAHDIGTPLGVVRGRAEYLAMQLSDQPNVQKNLNIMISEIDRVSGLIKSVLGFARGELRENVGKLSLHTAITTMLGLLNHEFSKRDIQIENLCENGCAIFVKGEPEKFQQVLMNILINSIHAIETAIKGGRSSGHKITIKCVESEDFGSVVIQDSGCGISDINMKNLFKPFFTTKEPGRGTGLGLVMAGWLVQLWGGTITVQSELNKGTTFKIQLPKVAE